MTVILSNYIHSVSARSGLYKLLKSEYSRTAAEISSGVLRPGLTEGKLHNDRTRNGTRGTSSDGIQRNKGRAIERTLDHTRRRRAQDHDSHSVESTGRGQGQSVDDHGD